MSDLDDRDRDIAGVDSTGIDTLVEEEAAGVGEGRVDSALCQEATVYVQSAGMGRLT